MENMLLAGNAAPGAGKVTRTCRFTREFRAGQAGIGLEAVMR
jgi:hypothetical protein